MNWNNELNITALIGNIVIEIKNLDDELHFFCNNGKKYRMYHSQDCCESVSIDDIEGNLQDLLNSPITQAEEVTNSEDPKGKDYDESFTWTFYKLATIKGYVTIKWYGTSNGYYSESVYFDEF